MIQPIPNALKITQPDGTIGADFHRWLQAIAQAISSTFVGDQRPRRNVLIRTGQFGIHGKRLVLGTKDRLVVEGDGRLVICG